MDLIWGHISPEPMGCPELKNIGLTLWVIQKTSVWFSRHVYILGPWWHSLGDAAELPSRFGWDIAILDQRKVNLAYIYHVSRSKRQEKNSWKQRQWWLLENSDLGSTRLGLWLQQHQVLRGIYVKTVLNYYTYTLMFKSRCVDWL